MLLVDMSHVLMLPEVSVIKTASPYPWPLELFKVRVPILMGIVYPLKSEMLMPELLKLVEIFVWFINIFCSPVLLFL
jgi:hypothetical protein